MQLPYPLYLIGDSKTADIAPPAEHQKTLASHSFFISLLLSIVSLISRPTCVESSRVTSMFPLTSLRCSSLQCPISQSIKSTPAAWWSFSPVPHYAHEMWDPTNSMTVTPMCKNSSPRLCAWPRREYLFPIPRQSQQLSPVR
jgi:hypothetical protein